MKVMKWIDVEVRLPPNDAYVLVAVWDGRHKVGIFNVCIKSRINERWYDDANAEEHHPKWGKITHWMPLPDDPQRDALVTEDVEVSNV